MRASMLDRAANNCQHAASSFGDIQPARWDSSRNLGALSSVIPHDEATQVEGGEQIAERVEETSARTQSCPPRSPLPELGDYELLERIGRGGMGVVFRARHKRLDRIVAVKVITEQLAKDASSIRRFEREVRAVGTLQHPHVVQAFDARCLNGQRFLVMEYVDGCNLATLVRQRGGLAAADACELIRQAALGLAHAHRQGIIHRDVKPHNLMLNRRGTVKVLDLGLARDRDDCRSLTLDAQLLGTLGYIAPEQVNGPHQVDHRSDIYSLGCTLYFLLTGSGPLRSGRTAQRLGAHSIPSPETLDSQLADVPPALQRLLRRMLETDPCRRIDSAAEVAELLKPMTTGANLRRLVAGEPGPVAPRRPRPFGRFDWSRRLQSWIRDCSRQSSGVVLGFVCCAVLAIVLNLTHLRLSGDEDDDSVLSRQFHHLRSATAHAPAGSAGAAPFAVSAAGRELPIILVYCGGPSSDSHPGHSPLQTRTREHAIMWSGPQVWRLERLPASHQLQSCSSKKQLAQNVRSVQTLLTAR